MMMPLGFGTRANIEVDMGSSDIEQCNMAVTLQKDFATSHIQYIYQGVHMLNYMQSISETLSGGY